MLVFTVFLHPLFGIFVLVLVSQRHLMFTLFILPLNTIIQTRDLHQEVFAVIVDFLEVLVLLHDCGNGLELVVELLLFAPFLILLYQIVVLPLVVVYLVLMLLRSHHGAIKHLIDALAILEILL